MFGDISIRSRFAAFARLRASSRDITPLFEPVSSITRSSRARILAFILVLLIKSLWLSL